MRTSSIDRKTNETQVKINLNLDGEGKAKIDTGCGFLNHMLTLFAFRAGFGLECVASGDTDVDFHHLTEDVGICLGKAVFEALGDRTGILRYSNTLLPMDEALILMAVDISNRPMLCFDFDIRAQKVGEFDTELFKEFLIAFSREARITLHAKQISGENAHHIIEGAFKALGFVMGEATRVKTNRVNSTKGVL